MPESGWSMLGQHGAGWVLTLIGTLITLLFGLGSYSVNQVTDNLDKGIARVALVTADHEQRIRTIERELLEQKAVFATRRTTNEMEFQVLKERVSRLERR